MEDKKILSGKNPADILQNKQIDVEKRILSSKIKAIADTPLEKNERYKRNPNLKRAGVKTKFSPEQIIELHKCTNDPIYFINNYCYIVSLDEGLVKFNTREYQDKLINLFSERRVVVKCPRQAGKCYTKETTINIIKRPTGFMKIIKGVLGFFGINLQSKKIVTIGDLFEASNHNTCNIYDGGDLKFSESGTFDNEILVEGEWGFIPITKIFKTVSYKVFFLKTNKGKVLRCADEHIVIDSLGNEIFIKDLNPGDYIKTIDGIEQVEYVFKTLDSENMYDLELENTHLYYTNGILSHNTITTAAYAVWELIFKSRSQIAILANKEKTAKGVLRKIRLMYENLPKWLQVGIVEWNKGSFALENGSTCSAASTSSSGIRGDSISTLIIDECVSGDTIIKIRDKRTGKKEDITIEKFTEKLKKDGEYCYDDNYEVFTPSGWSNFDGVKVTKRNEHLRIKFSDDSDLKCTLEHKIKVGDIFVKAEDIEIGDEINGLFVTEIIEKEEENKEFFDLICVEKDNEYYTNNVVSHNCAFIPRNIWKDFYSAAYPTVSSSKKAKIFLISTPYGMNHFYKFWMDSVNGAGEFKNYEIKWDEPPGRDEEWRNNTIADIGMDLFRQEYLCEFLGSAGTLIAGDVLSNLVSFPPIENRYDDKFKIYEHPIPNSKYICTFDTSEGVGLDYSTIQVFKISPSVFEQVAVFRDNTLPTIDFSLIIDKIGRYYNTALLVGENNSIGHGVLVDLVHRTDYENVFFSKKKHGICMTESSKRLGNAALKLNIEDNKFLLKDKDTLIEIFSYVRKKTSYQADSGKHDDLVTPLVILSYFLKNEIWVENWLGDRKYFMEYSKNKNSIDTELLPIICTHTIDEVLSSADSETWF